MKLHLPSLLRTALLSCYAAVTSFSTTIATSTLSIGVVSYVLSHEQTRAADVIFDGTGSSVLHELDGWAATGNVLIFAAGSENTELGYTQIPGLAGDSGALGSGVLTGLVVNVDGASLVALHDGNRYINGLTANALLDINGDFTIDLASSPLTTPNQYSRNFSAGPNNITFDIASGKTLTFKADLTGDGGYTTTITGGGTFDYHYSDTANNPGTQHTYNLAITGGTTLNLVNDTTTAASTSNAHVLPTGSLTLDSGNIVLLSDAATIGGAVTIGGTGTSTLSGAASLALNGAVSMQTGATLDLSAMPTTIATLTTAGTTAITGTGTLSLTNATIAAGSQLTLQSSTTNITGNLGGTGTLIVDTGKTANISGTLTSTMTITNNGTLNWTGVRFDLGEMGITGAGTHSLVTLTGTDSGFTTLTKDNITGFTTAGHSFAFNANGELVITQVGDLHTYTSNDAINWQIGTAFETGKTFADGDSVTFTGTPTVTLTENVSTGQVTIDTGADVTLKSDASGAYTLNGTIVLDGTLSLEGAVLHADARVLNAGTLELNPGDGNTLNYEARLEDFSGSVIVKSGTLAFADPAISLNAEYDLIAQAGATLSIDGVGFTNATMTLEDATLASVGDVATAVNQLLTSTGDSFIETIASTRINAGLAGSGTITKSGTAYLNIQSSLTYSGTLDMTEGNLQIGGGEGAGITVAFERIIMRGGTTWFNNNSATQYKTVQMDGGTFNNFDMDGGTMTVERMEVTGDSFLQNTYNGLMHIEEFTGDSKLTFNPTGVSEAFGVSIGEIVDYSGTIDMGGHTLHSLTLSTVTQGAGKSATIENAGAGSLRGDDFVMQGEGSLTINSAMSANSVTLAQGVDGSFSSTAALTTSSFSQTGAGTSTLSSLAINEGGSLYMTSAGTTTIDTLTLGATKASLIYDSFENAPISITNWGTITASLDVIILEIIEDIKGAGAYDLGIDASVDEVLINVVGYTGGVDYTLDDSTGSWLLTLNADATLDIGGWDINWGASVVAQAPLDIKTATGFTGNTYLSNLAEYNADGKTSVILNADSGTGSVFGGNNTVNAAGLVTDVWIMVTGGTWDAIVGGNDASWVNGGSTPYNFIGDTHIVVNQAEGTVEHIVGGNHQDGQNSTFRGDVYISVYTDTLTGTIIGGPTTAHQDVPVQTGDVNIFVYAPLTTNSADYLNGTSSSDNHYNYNDRIIGAGSWISNASPGGIGAMLDGDVQINIDLDEVTLSEATSFTKKLIGGSFSYNGWQIGQDGDSTIRVDGTANLTFAQQIIGDSFIDGSGRTTRTGDTFIEITGNGATFDVADTSVGIMGSSYHVAGATSTLTGNTNVTINGAGSIFNDRVTGASQIHGGTATITGQTRVTVNDGTFNELVMGSFNQHAGTSSYGGSVVTITGGSFEVDVVGAGVQAAGTMTNTGGTSINVTGATLKNNLYGGSIQLAGTSVNTTAGLIEMTLSGGTIAGNVIGGTQVQADFTGTLSADGGVNITVNGAAITGNIIGGHNSSATAAATELSMGKVSISLEEGSLTGNVYAAGMLATSGSIVTVNGTSVTIGSQMVFNGTDQLISGGFDGAGAVAGAVLGPRVLLFSDAGVYDNIDSLSYEKFNTINVTDVAGIVAIDDVAGVSEFSKDGAGTLILGAQTDKSINLRGGTLQFSAASSLTNLNISQGNLDLQSTELTVNGEARFSGTQGSLTMDLGHAGIALGASGSFGRADAADKLALTLTGWTADDSLTQVLVTGITDFSTLENITGFTELQGGVQGIAASALLAELNGAAVGADMYIIQKDNSLVLTNVLSQNLYWIGEGADNNWDTTQAADWHKDSTTGVDTAFISNDNVFFTDAGTKMDIYVTSAIEVMDMTVDGAAYTFTPSGNMLSIKVKGDLSVIGTGASLSSGVAMDLSNSEVTIATGNTLALTHASDVITIKSLNNAGTFTAASKLTIGAVTSGGILRTSGNVDLSAITEMVTFTELDANAVSVAKLTIGDGSKLGDIAGLSELVSSGTVEVDGITTIFQSFTNTDAFTANSYITVESFSNEGSVTLVTLAGVSVDSTLNITNSVEKGGTVTAKGVILQGATNSFDKLTVDGTLRLQKANAQLSVGKEGPDSTESSVEILAGTRLSLELKGSSSLELTTLDATTLATLSGTGDLTTEGALSLTGTAENKIGALTVKGALDTAAVLTATGAVTVDGALTTGGVFTANSLQVGGDMTLRADLILGGALSLKSPTTTITVGYSLATQDPDDGPSSQPVIKASNLAQTGASPSLNFSIAVATLNSAGLRDGESYILADLDDLTGIDLANIRLNNEDFVLDGSAKYALALDDVNKDIVLTMAREGNTWLIADGNGSWSDGTDWSGGYSPSSPDGNPADAILGGTSATAIEITLGAAETASSVLVETQDADTEYILTGGTLTTPSLQVTRGTLSLEGATLVDEIGATTNSQLVLGVDGTLNIDAGSSLSMHTLDYNAGGVITNAGALTLDYANAPTATITNTGSLILGHLSSLDKVLGTEGTLSTIAKSNVTISTLENRNLNLAGGSTLHVSHDMILESMEGTGALSLQYAGSQVTIADADGSKGVTSGSLLVEQLNLGEGSTAAFDTLSVDRIAINGDLSTTESMLRTTALYPKAIGGMVELNIDTTSLTNAVDAAIAAGPAGQTYYIYEQAGADWARFDLTDIGSDVYTHIEAGMDVLLTKDGTDKLTLTIQESTDRTWNTAENFAKTSQEDSSLSILRPIQNASGGMMSLDILDTVDKVIVSQDSSIDISALGAGTLTVSNLWGAAEATLRIVGDGSNTVKLSNSVYSHAQNAINAQNVTLEVESLAPEGRLVTGVLNLDNAILDATGATITVAGLSNVTMSRAITGSLIKGTVNVNGAGSAYTGGYENATVNFLQGADQELKAGDGLTVTGSAGHATITEASGSQMDRIQTTGTDVTIDMRNKEGVADADLGMTLKEASSMDGGTLTILLDEKNVEAGKTQQVVTDASQQFTLNASTDLLIKVAEGVDLLTLAPGSGAGVELIEISENLSIADSQIGLGSTLSKYFADLTYDPTTGIISAQINTDYYVSFAHSENGRAGLEMVTDVMINLNPLGNTGKYPELAEVMTALDDLLTKDTVAADRLAASIAGAGNLGLGMALSGDMTRQLGSIRNRTMSMGTDRAPAANRDEWSFNGWINAETSNTDLSGEGTAAGYELSSWGGTVGAEANVNERLTLGLAISSLYGDYNSNDVDSHTGEVNTNYLSAFARLHDGRWSHSFVISGGLSELSTSRTVSYAGGSYDTSGDTEGSSFGMLYELAYTYAMNEESSTAWQPLVSVAFQTSKVNSYTETGSDAALSVGEQSVAYATLGLGARMETVIGENIYNRSSVLSLRAMAKADFGDDSSEASVSMARGTEGSTVKSAERGMYGLEVGAGLVVPIMSGTSSIFFDANFEVRESQNSFSATAGYRFAF